MLKADLHTHSNVSDGSASIEEIVDIAVQNGLDAIAITDHDTLSHLARLPNDSRIKVIGGIEISAIDRNSGVKAHILGYGIQDTEAVEALVQPLLESRHATCLRQMEILQKHGFTFDIDAMCKADGKYIYKQHIMEYLVRTGQVPEMFGTFYQTTFKNGGICAFSMDYADVIEAVKTVVSAGGQAVLAHPGQQQNFYLLPLLVKCGMKGIECNHPSNGEEDRKVIKMAAEAYGLYLTGGSDFHGLLDQHIVEIGECISEESGIAALC
jgi:phosphoribosyl 1,2-cyclic phosphate 1,2-diphosphodiesterase